jgi:hypothetical protein
MKNKLSVMLIGGPQNGQIIELDDLRAEITIVARVMERTGKWREVFTAKYKLVSEQAPFEYKFHNPN